MIRVKNALTHGMCRAPTVATSHSKHMSLCRAPARPTLCVCRSNDPRHKRAYKSKCVDPPKSPRHKINDVHVVGRQRAPHFVFVGQVIRVTNALTNGNVSTPQSRHVTNQRCSFCWAPTRPTSSVCRSNDPRHKHACTRNMCRPPPQRRHVTK